MYLTEFARRQLRDICWGRGVNPSDVEARLAEMFFPTDHPMQYIPLSLPLKSEIGKLDDAAKSLPLLIIEVHHRGGWVTTIWIK